MIMNCVRYCSCDNCLSLFALLNCINISELGLRSCQPVSEFSDISAVVTASYFVDYRIACI